MFKKIRNHVEAQSSRVIPNPEVDPKNVDRESFFENYRANNAKIQELERKYQTNKDSDINKLRESEDASKGAQKSRSKDYKIRVVGKQSVSVAS